jgi:hypothetical protein
MLPEGLRLGKLNQNQVAVEPAIDLRSKGDQMKGSRLSHTSAMPMRERL